MPLDGAIIFKLDLLRVHCEKCGRAGRESLSRRHRGSFFLKDKIGDREGDFIFLGSVMFGACANCHIH